MKINTNKNKFFLLKATFMENAFKENERLLKEGIQVLQINP